MNVTIDENLKGKELFDFLIQNKSLLIAEKKLNFKRGDGFCYTKSLVNNKGDVVKANMPVSDDVNTIDVSAVINTTNWFDSHKDVHIPGLWKKSLSENKDLYLLQEHEMSFKGIITDQVDAYTQRLSWKSLGLDIEGYTEALIFDSTIAKSRNAFMFGEYKAGHVKNHSVGMRYVNITLAINSDREDFKEEFAEWNKYYDSIANKAEVDEAGYFWAVKEAKVIEGSAVPIGSNRMTPTRNVSTKQQPDPSTDDLPQAFDWSNALKQTTFIKI